MAAPRGTREAIKTAINEARILLDDPRPVPEKLMYAATEVRAFSSLALVALRRPARRARAALADAPARPRSLPLGCVLGPLGRAIASTVGLKALHCARSAGCF